MIASIFNFSTSEAARASVLKIAALVAFLQLLYPPKVWNNGFMTQPLGHVFILSDTMAGMNRLASGYASTSIAWSSLIAQLVITAVIAFGIRAYLVRK